MQSNDAEKRRLFLQKAEEADRKAEQARDIAMRKLWALAAEKYRRLAEDEIRK